MVETNPTGRDLGLLGRLSQAGVSFGFVEVRGLMGSYGHRVDGCRVGQLRVECLGRDCNGRDEPSHLHLVGAGYKCIWTKALMIVNVWCRKCLIAWPLPRGVNWWRWFKASGGHLMPSLSLLDSIQFCLRRLLHSHCTDCGQPPASSFRLIHPPLPTIHFLAAPSSKLEVNNL